MAQVSSCPEPEQMLMMHARGGFLAEWGRGRKLIPALCVMPEELGALVHLPLDPNLPIEHARAGGVPETSMGAGKRG